MDSRDEPNDSAGCGFGSALFLVEAGMFSLVMRGVGRFLGVSWFLRAGGFLNAGGFLAVKGFLSYLGASRNNRKGQRKRDSEDESVDDGHDPCVLGLLR